MTLDRIALMGLRRRSILETVAVMEAHGGISSANPGGTTDPTSFAGERIVESFGRPQILRRWLLDSDLRPELANEHHGRASYVLKQIRTGRPGTFTVARNGRFLDYHGGHGLRRGSYINWFTPEALRRGIGWYFVQTYRHGRQIVGRYKVIRIFGERGIVITKEPMRF